MKYFSAVVMICFATALAIATSALGATSAIHRMNKKITGSYIVRFDNASDAALQPDSAVNDFVIRHGVHIAQVYRTVIKGFAFTGTEAQAQAINADARVQLVSEDGVAEISTTRSAPSWGLDRIDQQMLPLNGTFTSTYDGTGVVIYILDTGVNPIADIAGRIVYNRNFTAPNGGAVDPNAYGDCENHGTAVAATAAGATFGVAPNASIINLKVMECGALGQTSKDSEIIAGLDWMAADHLNNHPSQPAVANMSFGGFGSDPNEDAAVRAASQAGITMVTSAGNNVGSDACGYIPAHLGGAGPIITVAASGNSVPTAYDTVASFSNVGQCVDLFAPGGSIAAPGADGTVYIWDGTSFSAPYVAGVAALHMQHYGISNSPSSIKGLIKDFATPNVLSGVPAGTPNLLLYSGWLRSRACC